MKKNWEPIGNSNRFNDNWKPTHRWQTLTFSGIQYFLPATRGSAGADDPKEKGPCEIHKALFVFQLILTVLIPIIVCLVDRLVSRLRHEYPLLPKHRTAMVQSSLVLVCRCYLACSKSQVKHQRFDRSFDFVWNESYCTVKHHYVSTTSVIAACRAESIWLVSGSCIRTTCELGPRTVEKLAITGG